MSLHLVSTRKSNVRTSIPSGCTTASPLTIFARGRPQSKSSPSPLPETPNLDPDRPRVPVRRRPNHCGASPRAAGRHPCDVVSDQGVETLEQINCSRLETRVAWPFGSPNTPKQATTESEKQCLLGCSHYKNRGLAGIEQPLFVCDVQRVY